MEILEKDKVKAEIITNLKIAFEKFINLINLKNFYYLLHLIYFQIINLKLLKSNEKISYNIFNTYYDDYPIDNIWKCN